MIWNSKYEQELIKGYRSGKSINEVNEMFKHMYHQDKYAFTSNALRSTIFKILRQGVRKLYEYVYNEGADHLPPVKKINSN